MRQFHRQFYGKLVGCLNYSAELHVPVHYKNYYKFWWTQELSWLKDNAIKSNKIWKEAGRPRTGPIADKRNFDNLYSLEYKKPVANNEKKRNLT